MVIAYAVFGALLALLWMERLIEAAFGIPQVADITRPEWAEASAGKPLPRLSIVVPALNEELHIAEALGSLLDLDYPDYEVIAVNDRSTDRTGAIMEQVASSPANVKNKLRVLHVRELPPQWLGKPHAMWLAAQQAGGEWLLFTDADVKFRPDALRRAVRYAEASQSDHLGIFPTMEMKTVGEQMMISYMLTTMLFGFFRAWKAPDPKARDYVGVGAFNLIRRSAYEALGTFAALRMEVVEDLKLGKLVKQNGFVQRVALGRDLIRIHWAAGAMGIVHNLSKNFFAFVRFQWWLALAAALGLAVLGLAPILGVLLAPGWCKLGYAVNLFLILLVYCGMSTKSDISVFAFLLYPLACLLFIYAILRSTVLALWNRGITWRGTLYPLDELKKGLV
jgi:cellulose synthase/poly-beta-1,6-N-acetylglucosamine synthase-like glycosyltransferase